MINVLAAIESLPRRSRLVVVGLLLRGLRPAVPELAQACGVSDGAVYGWINGKCRAFPTSARKS